MKRIRKIKSEDLPTEKEIREIIDSVSNPHNKAMLMALNETGLTLGELASVRFKSKRR